MSYLICTFINPICRTSDLNTDHVEGSKIGGVFNWTRKKKHICPAHPQPSPYSWLSHFLHGNRSDVVSLQVKLVFHSKPLLTFFHKAEWKGKRNTIVEEKRCKNEDDRILLPN